MLDKLKKEVARRITDGGGNAEVSLKQEKPSRKKSQGSGRRKYEVLHDEKIAEKFDRQSGQNKEDFSVVSSNASIDSRPESTVRNGTHNEQNRSSLSHMQSGVEQRQSFSVKEAKSLISQECSAPQGEPQSGPLSDFNREGVQVTTFDTCPSISISFSPEETREDIEIEVASFWTKDTEEETEVENHSHAVRMRDSQENGTKGSLTTESKTIETLPAGISSALSENFLLSSFEIGSWKSAIPSDLSFSELFGGGGSVKGKSSSVQDCSGGDRTASLADVLDDDLTGNLSWDLTTATENLTIYKGDTSASVGQEEPQSKHSMLSTAIKRRQQNFRDKRRQTYPKHLNSKLNLENENTHVFASTELSCKSLEKETKSSDNNVGKSATEGVKQEEENVVSTKSQERKTETKHEVGKKRDEKLHGDRLSPDCPCDRELKFVSDDLPQMSDITMDAGHRGSFHKKRTLKKRSKDSLEKKESMSDGQLSRTLNDEDDEQTLETSVGYPRRKTSSWQRVMSDSLKLSNACSAFPKCSLLPACDPCDDSISMEVLYSINEEQSTYDI